MIAVYGEDIFAEIVSEQCNLELLKPQDDWLAKVAEQFTKRKIEYGNLQKFINFKNTFIKCSDFKSFKAGVYNGFEDIKGFESLDLKNKVFISEVVDWDLEVRCFVLNGKIKTFSTYWRNNQFDTEGLSETEEKEMNFFFENFIHKYQSTLPNAVVLDFGIIKDRGWALIEANPAWCSGLYNCNPLKALDVIVKSCIKK